jgi:hypothetical protein
MAFKFDEISFNLKDVLLVISIVMYVMRSEQRQIEQFNQVKSEIAQIISDNKVNEVKVNARFDALIKQSKETSDKVGYKHQLFAICNDSKIRVKKRKLFKFRLIT